VGKNFNTIKRAAIWRSTSRVLQPLGKEGAWIILILAVLADVWEDYKAKRAAIVAATPVPTLAEQEAERAAIAAVVVEPDTTSNRIVWWAFGLAAGIPFTIWFFAVR
jgi:hypothetical protein